MLRRLFYRPLRLLLTEDAWHFVDDKPRLRHHIKILMVVSELRRTPKRFPPGFYEVKIVLDGYKPVLVFVPLRKK